MGRAPEDVSALNAAFGRQGAIEFAMHELGGVVARLISPAGRAVVSLRGGQVLSWTPAGTTDVLWISPMARLDGAKAIRGGIPVCWPWFGPHPEGRDMPAHGFARTATWRCTASTAGENEVALTLEPDPESEPEPAREEWPRSCGLSLTVTLSHALRLDLTTRNDGAAPLTITEALHSYFRVGEISRISVEGLEGTEYIDSVAAGAMQRQHGAIRFASEVDRIYLGTSAPVRIVDPLLARRITIAKMGSASTVVWNPWIDKAARLGDVGPDGYRHFVCIETANAGPNLVTVAAGGSHTMSAIFSLDG